MTAERLLIVDDSREVVAALQSAFATTHYEVLAAFDGRSGVELAISHHPELILLDMNMPGMNGLETLVALNRANCNCPAILMTAYGSEQIAVDAFRLGVRDYLKKPFREDEVKLAVDRALREMRLAREGEDLSRSLLAAETVRETTVTLSHYINNYLAALSGNLQLLDEALQQNPTNAECPRLVRESIASAANIEAVLRILIRITNVRLTSYAGATPMLDIRAALTKELQSLPPQRLK